MILCSSLLLAFFVSQLLVVLQFHARPAEAFRRRSRQAAPEVEEKDLYAILGVERDADAGTIRKAYRKLSRKYHPDKNPGDEQAAQQFQAISEANEILSDEEKKFMYDRGGMKAVAEAEQPQARDPFAAFFGGSAAPAGAPRTDPMHYEVPIDLATLYTGESMQTSIKVLTHCEGCKKGSEQRKSERCKACRSRCPNEIKMVQRQMGPGFIVNQQMEVPSEEKCKKESRTLDMLIEKGAHSGEELVFKGQGNRHPDKLPGDVHIQIKEQPHDFFTRSGDDLLVTWKISLKESLVGGRWAFPALDGHEVKFGTSAITKPGDTMRIRGEVRACGWGWVRYRVCKCIACACACACARFWAPLGCGRGPCNQCECMCACMHTCGWLGRASTTSANVWTNGAAVNEYHYTILTATTHPPQDDDCCPRSLT